MTKGYICEVVLALEYMHSKGIVYKDLRPSNILIASDSHIKIIDFYLARDTTDLDPEINKI